ncbi:MAG: hypothetical protein ACXV7H_07095 [Methylobacter sp.]
MVTAVQRCVDAGHTSVEQVRHALTRLKDGNDPEPAPVATPDGLRLNESPIADTGRYDQLSEKLDPARLVEESKDA